MFLEINTRVYNLSGKHVDLKEACSDLPFLSFGEWIYEDGVPFVEVHCMFLFAGIINNRFARLDLHDKNKKPFVVQKLKMDHNCQLALLMMLSQASAENKDQIEGLGKLFDNEVKQIAIDLQIEEKEAVISE
jgi:hypothetical protein